MKVKEIIEKLNNYDKDLDVKFLREEWTETCDFNSLKLADKKVGVITTGLGKNYFLENIKDLKDEPSVLHICAYPIPLSLVKKIAEHCEKLIVIEEGYPFLEEQLRGLLDNSLDIKGKLDGTLPRTGELNPDNVRIALGLEAKKTLASADSNIVSPRPPQLCKGCPHIDTYTTINEVTKEFDQSLVTSDIGCYALGALPPYKAIESIVCMGASVGMAKGAAEAGMFPVIATIGDSTFIHSGMTSLIDCVAGNPNMVLVIMDNYTVAMTGGQPTMIPSSSFQPLIEGLGVSKDRIYTIVPLAKNLEKNKETLLKAINQEGISVVFSVRECVETLKRRNRKK